MQVTTEVKPEQDGADRCTVIVSRPARLIGAPRNYGIFIDHEKVGILGNGGSLQFFVSPGDHSISWVVPQLGDDPITDVSDGLIPTIPGLTSEPYKFHLDPGATIKLICRSKPGWWKAKAYLEEE